ncbi:MAG: hypothetical protein GQ534_07430 [Candidatus Delongbacteria bacterium]|nr:hypothetical protein [Candidatus Delongbacteria bacterium]
MITKGKVYSIIYSIIFLAIVIFIRREELAGVSIKLLTPLAMIWFGEWFIDNFGGTIFGMFAAEFASFLEGKTLPVFGWFLLVFYSIWGFLLPNFTEVV